MFNSNFNEDSDEDNLANSENPIKQEQPSRKDAENNWEISFEVRDS